MTPFSTSTEAVGDIVRVSVLLETAGDGSPVREFAPYLDVDLDFTHAMILFGELGLALQAIGEARNSDNVVAFPGARG